MHNTLPPTADETRHCLACLASNADLGIRKDAHRVDATPLANLSAGHPDNALWTEAARTVNARRSVVSFSTRRSSFDLWASLGHLENLLSDYRRIAPRFSVVQLAGEAGVVTDNEYRLTIVDPDRLGALDAVCSDMAPGRDVAPFLNRRVMDVRVTRAGPWGGETGELVVEALENHALAGAGSLWLVAHGETSDDGIRVTLDCLEIARWAWAPDFLAGRDAAAAVTILDWSYMFERLIQDLDGIPEPVEPARCFDRRVSPSDLNSDSQIMDALRSHSALSPVAERMQFHRKTCP